MPRAISEIEHKDNRQQKETSGEGLCRESRDHGVSGSLARVTCVEERRMEWQNVNLKFESEPLAWLGRGRLARAHACGRASTSGCGGDGSMVTKAKAKPMSQVFDSDEARA